MFSSTTDEGRPNEKRATQLCAAALLAWSLCWAGAVMAISRDVVTGPLLWLVAALPTVAGLGALEVYRRWLRVLDEFQRGLQMTSLAVAVGASVLVLSTWGIAEHLGAPRVDVAGAVIVVSVVYSGAMVVTCRRYQ